ncbi:hypothetical protein EX895_003003 [Sporisorium graminicola]|uniref:Uncharacterized protein n=1 Tax=Sporisorium graminicola TaxID=280036 RepID=A0A4U7KUV4_9BASI|nr:hypothetical protein EX895_003003 [Sporisorium graminicola]TKY87907.1 hypothetical protein EX895_003003 [Sporisorium graminicola]
MWRSSPRIAPLPCRLGRGAMSSRRASLDDKIQPTPVLGDFVGWTPCKLARDYVYPELFEKRTTYAFVSFVVLDDRSHEDGKFVIVGVHPDSYKGTRLELEATARMDVESAVEMPINFHDDNQGILAYCEAKPYDNDAGRNSALAAEREGRQMSG